MPRGHRPRQKPLFIGEARTVHFKPAPLLFMVHMHYRGESTISHAVWHTGGPTCGITNDVGATVRRAIDAVVSYCHPANMPRPAHVARAFAAAAITSAGAHATSNTRWVHRKTTIKGDIGNTQITAVIHPVTKARVSSGGSARRTLLDFPLPAPSADPAKAYPQSHQ